MTFNEALKRVLEHEGGYVNHPSDPGGETNHGITKRVAENHGYSGDMRDIPMSTVKDIYRALYWDACRCSELPREIQFDVFDGAVNSGVRRSIQWLQKASGADVDGIVGPMTIRAARSATDLRAKYNGHRLGFLANLSHWDAFGRGWARRVADNLRYNE